MDCLTCVHLEQVFESRLSKYREARFSSFYRVSTEVAASKQVDMERARDDLEEHQSTCSWHDTESLIRCSQKNEKQEIYREGEP